MSGTQRIYGQYCKPTAKFPPRARTLQLLVHGLTSGHNYFNGYEAVPNTEDSTSWAAFANRQGYATLAIDRLGILNSDHPDPLQVVQLAYQVELYHELVQQLCGRSPRSSEAPNYWEKIIWVGHSYGSITGTSISAKYPEDADIFVQTGVAVPNSNQLFSLAPLLATYAPAAEFDRARFPASVYPAGYFTFSVQKARGEYFYTRPLTDFDPVKVDKELATEGTTTWGEALGQGFANSTQYDKPVFVMTG